MSKVCDFSEINIFSPKNKGQQAETSNSILEVRTPFGEFLAMLEPKGDKIYFKRQILFPNSPEIAEKIKESDFIKPTLASLKNKAKALIRDKKYNKSEVDDIEVFFIEKLTEYSEKYQLPVIRLTVPESKQHIVYDMGAFIYPKSQQWYAMEHMQPYYDFSAYRPKTFFSLDHNDLPLWDEETKNYYLHNDHPLLSLYIKFDALIKEKKHNPTGEFNFKTDIKNENKDTDRTQASENNQSKKEEDPNFEDSVNDSFDQVQKGIVDIINTGSKLVKDIEKGVKKFFDELNK